MIVTKSPVIILKIVTLVVLSQLASQTWATDDWGNLYNSIAWVTDARYHGVSRSDGGGALQTSVYWRRPDNSYAGVWLTQVDFNDPGETSYEVDIYAGKNFPTQFAMYTLELMVSAFPDNETPGPTYNFYQLKGQIEKQFNKLTLTSSVSYTPEASYASGVAQVVNNEVTYSLPNNFKVHALVGRRWIEIGYDRSYWELGVNYSWRQFELDLTFVDSNLSREKCFFTDNCSAAWVGELLYKFY